MRDILVLNRQVAAFQASVEHAALHNPEGTLAAVNAVIGLAARNAAAAADMNNLPSQAFRDAWYG